MRTLNVIVLIGTMICVAPVSTAAVTTYANKALWQAAVNNNFQTISFTEYPTDTIITTQYANRGATFTDGNDYILWSGVYLNDGAGLEGNFFLDNHISVTFAVPQHWMAMDFPGIQRVGLYSHGTLFYTSPEFGNTGVGWFGGLVSDMAFDRVVIYDTGGSAFLDDLFYNAAPAPGALALLVLAVLGRSSRRRL